MAEEEFPLIDGEYVSWANIDCSIELYDGPSFQTRDFSKIDWSDKLEPGAVRGTGPRKRGRTIGEYDCDATIGLYIAKAKEFQRALAQVANAKGKNGAAGLAVFDVKLQYVPLSDSAFDIAVAQTEIDLIGCRIKTRSGTNSSGTEGAAIEFPLDVMRILVDGVALV